VQKNEVKYFIFYLYYNWMDAKNGEVLGGVEGIKTDYESVGRTFESCRAHQENKGLTANAVSPFLLSTGGEWDFLTIL
jgi:hypothetical protein